MNTQEDSVQIFFRVYIPNETSSDMTLPFGSSEISGIVLPKKVTVKSVSSGSVWEMEMTTKGESGTVLLRDGWKKIVKEKNLQEPLFLVFEFDGSRLFHFSEYEHGSMCKRTRSPLEKEVNEVESDESDEEDDDDDDESSKSLNESLKGKARGLKSRRSCFLKADYGKYTEYLDDKMNPSFRVDITQDRTRIPALIIKDYSLKFPKSVIVRDNIGKLEKKLTVAVWTNRSVILNGLGSITRRNNVKDGDKVICELKMVNGYHGLVREVKVHIIKA